MALSVVISLGAMEGFLLISKLHCAQRILSEEQSQIRFLVSFLQAIIHSGILPNEMCGNTLNFEYPIVPIVAHKDSQLSIRICDHYNAYSSVTLVRLYISEAINKKGLTVYIQKDNKRGEVLVSNLDLFSVKFCSKKLTPLCVDASRIHDWNSLEAIEFTIQFKHHNILDHLVALDNHHVWQFRIKIGSHYEDQ